LVAQRTTARKRPPPRRAARRRPVSLPHRTVLAFLVAGLTLVSAWFLASGAVAFAGMITR
jgi:hypothetical protein